MKTILIQRSKTVAKSTLIILVCIAALSTFLLCSNPVTDELSDSPAQTSVVFNYNNSVDVVNVNSCVIFQAGSIINNNAINSNSVNINDIVNLSANSINLGSASVIRTSGVVKLAADKVTINTTSSASKINANNVIIDKMTSGSITVAIAKSTSGADLQLTTAELSNVSSKILTLSTSKASTTVVDNINILTDIARNGSITLLANNNIFVKQSKNILADLVIVTAGNALVLDKYARIKTNKDSLIATGANSVQLGYASILNGQGDVHVNCTNGDMHVAERAQLFSAKGSITIVAKKQAAVEKRALLKAFRDIAIRGDNEVLIGGKSCNTVVSSCNTPSGPTLRAGNNIVLTSKRIKIFAGAVLVAGNKIIENQL